LAVSKELKAPLKEEKVRLPWASATDSRRAIARAMSFIF
jgi:hypothetical protein